MWRARAVCAPEMAQLVTYGIAAVHRTQTWFAVFTLYSSNLNTQGTALFGYEQAKTGNTIGVEARPLCEN